MTPSSAISAEPWCLTCGLTTSMARFCGPWVRSRRTLRPMPTSRSTKMCRYLRQSTGRCAIIVPRWPSSSCSSLCWSSLAVFRCSGCSLASDSFSAAGAEEAGGAAVAMAAGVVAEEVAIPAVVLADSAAEALAAAAPEAVGSLPDFLKGLPLCGGQRRNERYESWTWNYAGGRGRVAPGSVSGLRQLCKREEPDGGQRPRRQGRLV